MFAKTLAFSNEGLVIHAGIRCAYVGGEHELSLYEHEGRKLVVAVDAKSPPIIITPEEMRKLELPNLVQLSFSEDAAGTLEFCAERDAFDRVLLFIDTYDEGGPERISGEYVLPERHDPRLPHAFMSTHYGPAHYGLVLCKLTDELLVRSSSGHIMKFRFNDSGKFERLSLSVKDRVLMGSSL